MACIASSRAARDAPIRTQPGSDGNPPATSFLPARLASVSDERDETRAAIHASFDGL